MAAAIAEISDAHVQSSGRDSVRERLMVPLGMLGLDYDFGPQQVYLAIRRTTGLLVTHLHQFTISCHTADTAGRHLYRALR
jgi:hypothetical protein